MISENAAFIAQQLVKGIGVTLQITFLAALLALLLGTSKNLMLGKYRR